MENYREYLVMGGLVLLIFGLAFAAYFVFFAIIKNLFKKDGLVKKLIHSMHKPILLLLMGFAIIISFRVLPFYSYIEEPFEHIVLIFVVISVGWLLVNLVGASHRHVIAKYQSLCKTDLNKRSVITQVHFIYRALVFIIIAVSLASILMTFPSIRSIGVGILGSAGILGIALGIAARPVLLNFIAGFQIAMTKPIKIGDTVVIEEEWGWIEHIHLTNVIVKIWDLRRLVVPISYFIDKPIQNWSLSSTDLIGTVFIYLDYTVPIDEIRKKLRDILENSKFWDQKSWGLVVTNTTPSCLELRATVSAKDASDAWNLRCHVREELIKYVQLNHPGSLPFIRRAGTS